MGLNLVKRLAILFLLCLIFLFDKGQKSNDWNYICCCPVSWVMSSSFVTPWKCSPSGSSVHGIPQARILVWVAMPFSRESSQTRVSCIDRWVLLSHQRSPKLYFAAAENLRWSCNRFSISWTCSSILTMRSEKCLWIKNIFLALLLLCF